VFVTLAEQETETLERMVQMEEVCSVRPEEREGG